MNLLEVVRLKSFIQAVTPIGIQETVSRTWKEVGDKVDAFYRGVSAYAFKAPENTRSDELLFLASRAKFINPTFQQFIKTLLFYGLPAGFSLRAAIPITLGTYLPMGVVAAAIIGLTSLGTTLGFIRQALAGNDLERALRAIIKHNNPDRTLEMLPEARFVNNRIEMGQNPVVVVKNRKSGKVDYVAFRYVEKDTSGDKIHTRIYSIGSNWINTGTTVMGNHICDISTSLEGGYIADLLIAARGEPFNIALPPVTHEPLPQRGMKGLLRAFSPDVARQTLTNLGQEIAAKIDSHYLGKSAFVVADNEKNQDLRFLATRDNFINPTLKELIKTVLFFGFPAYLTVRYFATLSLGPYMPITATLTSVVGFYAIKYLAGVFRQYYAGNDLEKALIALVRASSPQPQIVEPSKTVLDYLPEDTGAETVAVQRKGTKINQVIFRYKESLQGREKDYVRIYKIGSGWSRSGTTFAMGKVTQISTTLKSKDIEKLLTTTREHHVARIRALRAAAAS